MHTSAFKMIGNRLRRFARQRSGIAAVEFAYLAPLLMLMTFGTFEIARALLVHKRFQRATYMVGDLVAREEQLGTTSAEAKAALDGIMRSAEHALWPYSSTPLQVGILQLRANATNATVTTVEWSYAYHNKSVTKCPNVKAMPASNMITAGNAAILVESTYSYTPLLTNIIPDVVTSMTWNDTMTFAPRYGSVFYGQSTQNLVCPT